MKIQQESVLPTQYVPNSLTPDGENQFPVPDSVSVFADSCVHGPSLIVRMYNVTFLFATKRFGRRGLSFRKRARIFQFGELRLFV